MREFNELFGRAIGYAIKDYLLKKYGVISKIKNEFDGECSCIKSYTVTIEKFNMTKRLLFVSGFYAQQIRGFVDEIMIERGGQNEEREIN